MKAYIMYHSTDDRGYHHYLARVNTKFGTRFFYNVRKPHNIIDVDIDGNANCFYNAKNHTFLLLKK